MAGDEVYGDDVTSPTDDEPIACSRCGATETVELHDPRRIDHSITICANCGSDE